MKADHKKAQRTFRTWAEVDDSRGPSDKLVSDGVAKGTRSGLGPDETVIEKEPGFIEAFNQTRPVRRDVKLKSEPTLRPHMAILMGSAYNIANDALAVLQKKVGAGDFGPKEASMLKAIVSSIVDLSREERAQLSAFNPEEFDNDALVEILDMAKSKLR